MGRPSKAAQQARRIAAQQRATAGASPVTKTLTDPDPAGTPVPVGADGAPLFDPLLTADQVARWLGKPKATLYAWRTRGQGPRGIKVGGDLRYRRRDVEAYLEHNTDPRTSREDFPLGRSVTLAYHSTHEHRTIPMTRTRTS